MVPMTTERGVARLTWSRTRTDQSPEPYRTVTCEFVWRTIHDFIDALADATKIDLALRQR